MTVNQKNPWIAAIASFFIGGWGHIYNGESWIIGIKYFFLRFWILVICIAPMGGGIPSCEFLRVVNLTCSILFFVCYPLFSGLDACIAFSRAQQINNGERPFKENSLITMVFYPFPIIILTLLAGLFWIVFVVLGSCGLPR